MRVVIDKQIPYIKGQLEQFAEVRYIQGSDIKKTDLSDTDALIIRTRTKADRSLLEGSAVKFVGTATIGTDHIDTEWCARKGIYIASAPGCNSASVMQYIASVLAELLLNHKHKTVDTTIGIIGVGNVGSKVARLADALGLRVLLNDPPRERKEGSNAFSSLDKLLKESDILTLHVPLSLRGEDATWRLIDPPVFEQLKPGLTLINTSRGGIIDERSLVVNIRNGKVGSSVNDVWEGEPYINRELMESSFIATPHIAGYSADGKLKGARMITEEFCTYFGLPFPDISDTKIPEPSEPDIILDRIPGNSIEKVCRAILHTCPVRSDHNSLLANPASFEMLRNNYGLRREFNSYTVYGASSKELDILSEIGFLTRIHKH